MKPLAIVLFSLTLACGLIACGEKSDPGINQDSECPNMPAQIEYATHIAPIMTASCTGCHSSTLTGAQRGGAPVGINYDSYAHSVASAEAANRRIQAGTMPPGAPLNSEAKCLFDAWLSQTTPE